MKEKKLDNNYFIITSYNNFLSPVDIRNCLISTNQIQHTFKLLKQLEQYALRTYENNASNLVINGENQIGYMLLPISNLNNPSSITKGFSQGSHVIIDNFISEKFIQTHHLTTCNSNWPNNIVSQGCVFALTRSDNKNSGGITKYTNGKKLAPLLANGSQLTIDNTGMCIVIGNDEEILKNQVACGVKTLINNDVAPQIACELGLQNNRHTIIDNRDLTILYVDNNCQIFGDTTLPVFNFNVYNGKNKGEKLSLFPGGSILTEEQLKLKSESAPQNVPAFKTETQQIENKPVFTSDSIN